MNNDPTINTTGTETGSLHRGETLEENLKHLRERLRYLTVVDRDSQVVGVVDDLVITPDHCLKLVIAEASPSQRIVLLDSKHILKASAREQLVYLDALQSEVADLVEVNSDNSVDKIWPEQPASALEAPFLEAPSAVPQDQEVTQTEASIPSYPSLTEIATEEEFQFSSQASERVPLVDHEAEPVQFTSEDRQSPVIAFQADDYEVRTWQTIASASSASDLEEFNLLALTETDAISTPPHYEITNTTGAEAVDNMIPLVDPSAPAPDLSDLFTELPPVSIPAIRASANDSWVAPMDLSAPSPTLLEPLQPTQAEWDEAPLLQQEEPAPEPFSDNFELDEAYLFLNQQDSTAIDPMAGWDTLSEEENASDEEEVAPFISEAELLELFPPDASLHASPDLEPWAEPLVETTTLEAGTEPKLETEPIQEQMAPIVTLPLKEERLLVNYMRRKMGEVVIRKRIDTRMVQVPLRYETLVIEQVSPEQKSLVEVDLSGGDLSGVEISTVGQDPAVVKGTFTDPESASQLLQAIAHVPDHRCKTIRIEIELTDPELQARYQDWMDQ